ncbi:ribosomal protein S18-alanine N-acetyltransferase [Calothrix sp. NIES-3974]|uniref:ribosomal protein S18-alanine N-acetyltransferase n=1 Tax=Calothrix sp. NIES-3974 TaxID=2005462 RepID=UPI000B602021|nr:ribosomal protein S18-alanine N-acetyltransferase [Calothrix sp. NIES-3974]BAZ04042.1 ribosomal-protein-alanine acetyltransferase [Calothrix sp. NIES-3974]
MNIANLELQHLNHSHISMILEIDRACFGGLWTIEAYQRELDSPNSDIIGVIATPSSLSLLGIACVWSILEEAHITILAVHPQYQGQGLGQLLLWGLLQIAHERSLERATLEVRASNKAAISLYRKFGFQTAGRRKRYYQDNGEDALILWRGDLQRPHFPQQLDQWQDSIRDRLRVYHWHLIPEFG